MWSRFGVGGVTLAKFVVLGAFTTSPVEAGPTHWRRIE